MDAIAATPTEDQTPGLDDSTGDVLLRLVSLARYEAPKVVSFPFDGLRVTELLSLAGNI